jgi:hypothetical protein
MIHYEDASYLAQVRRARALAERALREYPVRLRSLRFINHGENSGARQLGEASYPRRCVGASIDPCCDGWTWRGGDCSLACGASSASALNGSA